MKAQALPSQDTHLGFQIAPMIDVVFVIMLFFMVMAGAIKAERLLSSKLPGEPFPGIAGVPNEILIAIGEDGTITMNEEEYDYASNRELPTLKATLLRLSQDAEAHGERVLVTIQAEERAAYQRIVDVLNALTKARLSNVTFTIGDAE